MLSSQTKDEITSATVAALRTSLPGGLNAEAVANADPRVLDELIKRVGFHNRKTE